MESDRWLDLPTDTHRLAYENMLLKVDDFGNIEGGRRLWRFVRTFTQIKSEDDFVKLMIDLQDVDLVRRYEVEGREFYHAPRFRPHRQYMSRKMPKSPWDDERELGKNRRVVNREFAKDQEFGEKIATTSLLHRCDVVEGVGVVVGVGVGEVPVLTPTTELNTGRLVLAEKTREPADQKKSEKHSKNASRRSRYVRLDSVPDTWRKYLMAECAKRKCDLDADRVYEDFCDWWKGDGGVKADWLATWQSWVRKDIDRALMTRKVPSADQWWRSNAGVDSKGRELSLTARGGESYESYKARIFEALKEGK